MRKIIVFDIGGTYFRSGLYCSESDMIINQAKIESPNFINNGNDLEILQKKFEEKLLDAIAEIVSKKERAAIGIAFPGPVSKDGIIKYAPTLWGNNVFHYDLKAAIHANYPFLDIEIVNDLTAAGYRYKPAIKGHFCIITISSGVGCKVFWDGEVLLNDNGFGGELGHHTYSESYCKIRCDCGGRGHIGAISSGRGFQNIFKLRFNENISTWDLKERISNNDPKALACLVECIKPIAVSISSLYSFIGIDQYIMIGGLAVSLGETYKKELVRQIREMNMLGITENQLQRIVVMGHDDDLNGLLGMGRYMIEKYNSDKNWRPPTSRIINSKNCTPEII